MPWSLHLWGQSGSVFLPVGGGACGCCRRNEPFRLASEVPMHRGPAGAGNLNTLLQEALTPQRDQTPERRYGGRVFRIGDKVTQLRNNYDKGKAGIFNGTVGARSCLLGAE